ncbi:GNAT family N-acetyltransferase [Streptomyces sp. NPDC014894]|uniref:GNAT family N-acetyltransferase n=1 Tax=Streptomyces sp. NPDC014894 TaxID=3364931 RepID=UPI0036F64638
MQNVAVAMTDMPRPAVIDDAGQISGSLARAFGDDPMMCWLFPRESSRETSLSRYFTTLFTRQYIRSAVCERTADAAAFWMPPEARDQAVPDAGTIEELRSILGDRADAFAEAVTEDAKHTPREPHWYLALIGADPIAQGTGQGAALVRSGLARADAAGLPARLESSKASNIPFYEHFGFTVTDEVHLPGGGPPLWSMRRAPADA